MAKRKSRSHSLEPAVQTIALSFTVFPGQVFTKTADLSQIASIVNRRFYRQGLNWGVAGIKFVADNPYRMSVLKLPNTWILGNSWEKSMRTWSKMNRDALAETQSIRPRFLDFKVYADAIHHADGYASNLLPFDGAVGTPFTPGEWEPSKIVVPFGPASPGNTTDFELIACGASYPGAGASGINAVSLIEGYAASRGLPAIRDPNAPDDARDTDGSTPENWMAAIFNEGTDQDTEVLGDMFENNKAPYPYENDGLNTDTMYPNGANQGSGMQLHDFALQTSTTIGGMTRVKGGSFPCGLVRFQGQNDSDSGNLNLVVLIDLIPGPHRGYLCEPMTEM